MTAVEPAVSREAGPPRRVPFPVVDEISRHCLDPAEPETVHIEVHLPGRLDPERFRAAFTEALLRHPGVLMREAPGGWYRRRYEWELTRRPEVETVTFSASGPGALERARTRALTSAPSLAQSPPVRVEVVQPPEGTEATDAPGDGPVAALIVTLNHTALDGPACMRILATAAALYGGVDNEPPVLAPARPGGAPPGSAPAPTAASSAFTLPARVARGNPGSGAGNAMLVMELPVPGRPKGAPYTVNDQLMVATALTVAEWNERRGARPRPPRITMPVDDRSRGADMPIGNGTRLVEVPYAPRELSEFGMAELLRRTADRTRLLKARPGPQLGRAATLLAAPVLPVAARALLVRSVRRLSAPLASTTLLSNIGRIPYPLDFGDAGRARAVWFSAPARLPRGLSVTAASTDGKLHLALRWSRSLLGPADGAALRDIFVRHLASTAVDARPATVPPQASGKGS
ncbi:condensation protein [Streptomyces sp. NA04227]|uniref:condensation protein n=1 Tax=Streptomyces sp. NA04227 TaxID=2742136 RepID=UPI001591AA73|nr:condensation protein [Streptomyces sp. NA04227]QKW05267.1 condensation protein [Streptomyces sp. NA04227]